MQDRMLHFILENKLSELEVVEQSVFLFNENQALVFWF